jgi:signal transduction histidine kinase
MRPAAMSEPAPGELRRALYVRARDSALRADVSGALTRADSLRGMLQSCAEALVRHLDAAFARIWTSNRAGDFLELQASAGLHTNLDGAHARIRVGELKIGMIAQERAPHLTNHILDDARVHDKDWARREGLVAFAGYPLLIEERVVGVMAMFAREALLADTLETLASIASLIAHGIERKRSDDRLRRSEAYLAEGQRLSHTGSWAWRLDTGERFWSLEVYRIYGFEPADTPPPLEAVLVRVHPDDAARVRLTVAEALRTFSEFRFQTRVLIDGQTLKYVETIGHPVRGEDGRVVEFIGTDVDITERRRANQRLRRAIRARYAAVLAERTRIARDMHDGLLQDVTGIALQLAALLPQVRATSDAAADRLANILELTQRTSREARRAVVDMRSAGDEGDLLTAVEASARKVVADAKLSLSVSVKGQTRSVPPETRDAIVAIVQEAMTNVVKHAAARSVAIGLVFTRTRIRLTVHDDGCGLPAMPDVDGAHFGLVGMRERASEIGAAFRVRSRPGAGTTVSINLPSHAGASRRSRE